MGADPDDVLGMMTGLPGPLGLGYLALIAAYMIAIAVSYEFLRAYHLGEVPLMQPGDLWKPRGARCSTTSAWPSWWDWSPCSDSCSV